MTKNFRPFLIISALVLFFASASANATEDWSQGKQAFQQHNYSLALSFFEKARDAGQGGPAVHYNIGVCQYKLRNYSDARRTFTRLNDDYPKMRSLAQYNLGLVALQESQRSAAINHFRDSYYLSTEEPKLRAMSSTMLRRMIGENVPKSHWMRTISVRGGYDDNVSLQDETGLAAGISADSPFAELFGTLRGPYTGRSGFRVDGGFYLLNYSDAEEFSQSAVHLGGLYDWRSDDWGLQVGAHVGTTTLGGDGFDRSSRLSARFTRNLTPASSVSVRLRYDDITAINTLYSGVEGTRQRFDIRYRWYLDGRSFNITYGNESNDRLDPSVSPDRNKLRFDYRFTPEIGWGFEIGGQVRASEYSDGSLLRDEDLVNLNLGLTRNLSSGWQLFARYAFSQNESSDPEFDYTRSQVSFGAYRFF